MRVEGGERSRLLTHISYTRCAVSQDLAAVHDEVVKRLRRSEYKDGWEIDFKLTVIPVVKVVVTFSSVELLLRMFRVDRLVSGGSMYAAVHSVFVRYFKVGAPNPYSGMFVRVDTLLFCHMHNTSASSVCAVSGSMLMLKALLLCRIWCLYPPASIFVLSSEEASPQQILELEGRICIEV